MLQCNECERRGCTVMTNSRTKPWNESRLRSEYSMKGKDNVRITPPSWWHRTECKRHVPINGKIKLTNLISKITISDLYNPVINMMKDIEVSKGTEVVVRGGKK